ncbi:hypothetical protein EV130_10124 [Rhizobium azibense]|uniref:Uncharacterized protein n=2 Tax=Rhizobium azibense TaxID=1136135 RepID=A0A4R3R5Q4_9HYPH|nr:hypothetical protein EV130_10124 [Rhizobium azibense]
MPKNIWPAGVVHSAESYSRSQGSAILSNSMLMIGSVRTSVFDVLEDELLEISAGKQRLVDVPQPFLGRIELEVARERDVDVPGA